MKVLVVGGTGLIGGHAALHLQKQGHEVSIGSRNPAPPASALAELRQIRGDYVEGGYSKQVLSQFDALVFTAGSDIRHLQAGNDQDSHWQRANIEGIPRFFALARDAGIRRAVYVGSFYPQILPGLIETVPYVRSRHLADEGVRALANGGFSVCSVNAPFVVGSVPGLKVPMFEAYTQYALGLFGPMPVFGPPGGTNFMSTQSLSEAIQGALLRGVPGKAYLVGDENLPYRDYLAAFFRSAGNETPVPVIDQEHPLLPDWALYAGRGNFAYYEPDAADAAMLAYRRSDVLKTVAEVVRQYLPAQ